MNTLSLIGLNHKTAPIAVREQFFMGTLERELLLSELKNDPNVLEAFVLSTCNRIEVYAHLLEDCPEILFRALSKVKKTDPDPYVMDHFYVKSNQDVVDHLFDVACGLDSLVIGEKQILGQVKDAAQLSRQAGIFGRVFNVLVNIVLNAGKTAQSKTQISSGGSSVSWAAVTSAHKILETLQDKSILIIGAGKMSQLTAGQLVRKAVGKVFVMNRTFKNAQTLARTIGAQAVMFWDMKNILTKVDVCICSSGASYFLIEQEMMREVMALRNNRPLLLIDISTPRNIDPLVSQVEGVRLVSMDDLDVLIRENLDSRRSAVEEVRQIISQKKDFFNRSIFKCEQHQVLACSQ
jgi:glutamyl-tRNA reductase